MTQLAGRKQKKTDAKTDVKTNVKSETKTGKLLDVRTTKDVPELESVLSAGPMTIVLVYADWCGHCTRFKENVWSKVSVKGNKMNRASVHYDMLTNTSLKDAKLEGYPSLLMVGKDKKPAEFNNNGETTNAMPQPKTPEELTQMLNVSAVPSVAPSNNEINVKTNINKNSYTPSNMGLPPNTTDDLQTESVINKKQQGGNLFKSLLHLLEETKTKIKTKKSKSKRNKLKTRKARH